LSVSSDSQLSWARGRDLPTASERPWYLDRAWESSRTPPSVL
jgi:hypothetical protein